MGFFKKKKEEPKEEPEQELDWTLEVEAFANDIGNTRYAVDQILTLLLHGREQAAEQIWDEMSEWDQDGAFWFLTGLCCSLIEFNVELRGMIEGDYD